MTLLVLPSVAAAAAALSPSSDPLPFPDTLSGQTSGTVTLTLTNTGDMDADVTALTLSGTDAADFAVLTATPFTITTGSSAGVDLTFSPSFVGAHSATLTIDYFDGGGPASLAVALSGNGMAGASLSASVDPLVLANTRVGATSAPATVTLTNGGDMAADVTGLVLSGATPGDFTVVTATPFSIPPAGTADVDVTFSPSARGLRGATLTVEYDGPLASNLPIGVQGTGIAPDMVVSVVGGFTSPLDFGAAKVDAASATTHTLRVSNTGDDVLNASFAESGANPGDWSYSPAATSFAVAAGGFRDIVATFTPRAAGSRGARWTVTDDDGLSTTPSTALDFDGVGQVPGISVSPDPLSFTSRLVFTTSGSQPVSIDNTGTADLVVSSIQLTGGDVGDFALITSLPMVIGPGASGSFSVTFNPQARGARSATVSITSDAAGSPTTMTVEGTGLAPVLSVSPSSLSFPATRVGQTSAVQTFSIDNTGDWDMSVTSVSIPGANADDYSVTLFSGTIAPSDPPVVISVQFTPKLAGAQPATVVVATSNPLPPASANVALSGTGTEAILVLSPAAGYDFGDTRVAGQSGDGVFSLQNTGNVSLTVSNLAFGAPDGSQFSIVAGPAAPFSIAPSATRNVTVRCTPSSTGDKASTFDVTSNADNAASVPIPPLACRGVTPEITVSPLSLTFGAELLGVSSTPQTFTVSNAGGALSAPLAVTISKLGPASADFVASPTSFTVPVGGSRDVSVTFTPSVEGARSATIRVNSDDLTEPTTDVAVSGTGVKPEITLLDPPSGSIAFGDVNVSSSSAPQIVRVRNDGSSALTLSAIALAGANPGQFAITAGSIPPPNITLAVGGTASWSVVCTPSSTGGKSALFRITSDDADEGTVNVPLSCTGVQAQLTVSPSPVSFPVTRVCESADPITVTVRNSGTADLTVNSVSVTPTSVFPIDTPWPGLPLTLGPNQTFTFALGFTPAMHSDYSGTITIVSDDPISPTTNVTILGPGRVADMTLSELSYDYGGVRVDQPAVERVFTIKNSGTANFVVGGVSIDDTLDFTVEPVSPASLPTTLLPAPAGPGGTGQEATFRVLAHPAILGATPATVTVTTDIPGCLPIMATIDVDAEGIAPDMTLDPTVLDYGGHDVQAAQPAKQTATITNTGTAPLEVDGLSITGTYADEFSFATPPSLPVTIPVGGTLDLEVDFRPGVMRACNSDDGDAFVDVTSDGFTVAMARVRLEGCGLDRIINLSTMGLAFPPTYRNPAEPATLGVQIANTGTFKLAVSATATSDMDVFELVNGGPREIAPGESDTLEVAFKPTAASPIPFEGTLTIANDDDDNPMADVSLSGVGLLPEVVCDPCNVAFGGTAVGARTTIPGQKIHINNMNTDRSFTVRELRLVDQAGEPLDEAAFEILGFDGPIELPPMTNLELDVAFTPDAAGAFQARVDVFVDIDETVQTFVTLTGEGIGARARGSGCGVAAGSGGSWLWIVALALLLGWRRRGRTAVAVATALVLLAAAGEARADRSQNIDLATFRPAGGGDPRFLTVEDPAVGHTGTWSLGVFFDYARRPLGIERTDLREISYPVENRTATELAIGYAFGGRFELGARLPMLSQSGDERMLNVDPASGTAIGDLAVTGKAVAVSAGPFAFGGSTVITLPTATDQEYAGVDWPTWHARAIASASAWRLRVAANVGMRLRKQVEFVDVVQGNELTFGFGTSYRASRRATVIGELYGAMGLEAGGSEGAKPVEAALGVRYRMSRAWGLGLGASRGVLPGLGAPSLRTFVLLAFTPGAHELVPLAPLTPDKVIDRGDDDADSIINEYDRCPDTLEDYDDFEDDDGCPDLDNDGDGIADDQDRCPNEAEDADGYQDADGCVDEDNDGDGIADTDDRCPNEIEDKDGYRDADGCDDPDNDRDGIPDVIDQCAVEPETINGRDDDDGCPDDGDSAVLETDGRIDVIEPIRFRGNGAALTKSARRVLGQVGALLRARPEWTKIRIGVHVHPRTRRDEALSVARAEAVQAWLVDWGVEAARLEVKGFGSSRPLVPRNARRARSINDRVEFVIIERAEHKTR